MVTHNITLCIGASGKGKKAIVKCHDTGVNFRVKLEVFRHQSWKDAREPYVIPEESTAIIKVAKPDKTHVRKDGIITNQGIVFEMPPQTFTVEGVSVAEVSLYDSNGRRITTASFSIEVEKECIDGCETKSEDYVDILAEQIKAATEAADKVAEDAAAGKFNGKDGKAGKDGYTPVRGVDYWTDEDKEEIQQHLDSQMDELEAIVKGRATGYVFNTLADLEAWLSDSANTANLVLGDNLYIRATNVPDYWWDGESKQELETQKVDLTEYVKNTDYASLNKAGLAKVNTSWGIGANADGGLWISAASNAAIDNRNSSYAPIVPANLEYAVKSVGDGYYATEEQVGEIGTALDNIITIQNELLGVSE